MPEQAEQPAAEPPLHDRRREIVYTQKERSPEEPGLGFEDIVRFFERYFLVIFGCAAGAGLLAALFVLLLAGPVFEASATLVVLPSQFKSALKPPALSVQGYQQLLESGTVVAETTDRLIERGVLEEGETLRIGRRLSSRIFVSRRAEETALAPVIQVLARAREPEKAAAITNSWCLVFLEHVEHLVVGTVNPTYEFVSAEHGKARNRLADLENREIKLANDYQKRIHELTSTWDRRILTHKKDTEDLIAAYQAGTREEMEKLARRLYDAIPDTEGERDPSDAVSDTLERQMEQIVALRTQLAQTPQLLTLEKAISDDALWETILSRSSTPVEYQERIPGSLRTQELNPVYTELALKLSTTELELVGLDPAERQQVRTTTAEMERVQRQRSAGLSKLIAERSQRLDELERAKQQELSGLQRERAMALEQMRRDISDQKLLYDQLATSFSQAELARAEQDLSDVRLASPAAPPRSSEPQRAALKIAVAVLVGGMLGLVVAGVREIHARNGS